LIDVLIYSAAQLKECLIKLTYLLVNSDLFLSSVEDTFVSLQLHAVTFSF